LRLVLFFAVLFFYRADWRPKRPGRRPGEEKEKKPTGFPGSASRRKSEPFHRFLLPIPYPERSSVSSSRGRLHCENKKRSLGELAGRSDWSGRNSLRTEHLRRGGRLSEAKTSRAAGSVGRKRDSLGVGCVCSKRSALLSRPADERREEESAPGGFLPLRQMGGGRE